MSQIMNEKKWFSCSSLCIVNIAKSPAIAAWLRLRQKISGNRGHLDVFVDQRCSDSRTGREKNSSDDSVFYFHSSPRNWMMEYRIETGTFAREEQ